MATTRRSLIKGAAALGGLLAAPAIGRAESPFPSRPVRIIVPFPAGGTTDMLARLFAQHFSEALGQNAYVENVGGGGGSIGAEQVARAVPDGHTLLFHNITFTTTTSAMQFAKRARHDIEADFVPISVGAWVPFLFLAHPSVPAKDLKEFVAHAKNPPSPLFYGSTGPGSTMNLLGELLKRDSGIKMDHVPFRGAAPMVTELLSGRIHFGGDQLSTSLQHARSGNLRGLALTTRSAAMPEVATVAEQGFPSLEVQGWNGFLAPKGTPDAVVERVHKEVAAACKRPDFSKRMTDAGAEPSGNTPQEMREMLRKQIAQIKPAVEELKLVLE